MEDGEFETRLFHLIVTPLMNWPGAMYVARGRSQLMWNLVAFGAGQEAVQLSRVSNQWFFPFMFSIVAEQIHLKRSSIEQMDLL